MGAAVTVSTARFGAVTVDEDEIITLADGLLGFVRFQRMIIVPVNDDGLFWWLQSVDDPDLAFLSVVPWAFFVDYELALSEDDQQRLSLATADDALVYCLVTVHDDPRSYTANLLGPVVVHRALRLGRQVVLDADVSTRAPLGGAT